MKLLLIGDFHGIVDKKLVSMFNEVDAVVTPGDFACIDGIRDLFLKHGPGFKELYSEGELDKIRVVGLRKSLVVFRALEDSGLRSYFVFGNSEKKLLEGFNDLVGGFPSLVSVVGRGVVVDRVLIVGFPTVFQVGETDEFCKGEVDKIKSVLDEHKGEFDKVLFLSHEPPINSNLDKVENKKNARDEMHVGSSVVRAIIEKIKPDWCVCGHIHEGQGIEKIGDTVVVNTGAAFEGKGATLDTVSGEVELIK